MSISFQPQVSITRMSRFFRVLLRIWSPPFPRFQSFLDRFCIRFRTMTRTRVDTHAALFVMGMVSTVIAGVSHWQTLRRWQRGESPLMRQWPLSITVAMLLAVISA